jgi:hypothetical protein
MLRIKIFYFLLSALFLLAGCNTGFHGSFATNTYIYENDDVKFKPIGPVKGQSCQTKFLYIFPLGSSPSTEEAIQSAKDQFEGTKYLTDVSIDDRVKWEFGYSIQCIVVEAIAHR